MNARTLAAVLLALGASGCTVPNDASVKIDAVCFPPTPDTTTGGCVYPAKCDSIALGIQYADLSLTGGTLAVPLQVTNQLPDNTDLSTLHLDTNGAVVTEYHITYSWAVGPVPDQIVKVSAHEVAPGGTSVDLVDVVPASIGPAIGAIAGAAPLELDAEVRVAGHYRDGRSFESGPFRIPTHVCSGCVTVPTCPGATTGTTVAPVACPQVGQYAVYACPSATP